MHERLTGADPDDRLRLTTGLSAASDLDEVADVVGRWAPPVAAAAFANLAMFDAAASCVRVVHGPDLDADIAQRWSEFPIDAPTPLCTAILTGEPVLLADLDAIGKDYAALLDDTTAAGLQATASLPLKAGDGSVIGAIGLAWPQPQPFDEFQLSELALVSELITRAAQRATRRPGSSPAATRGLQAVHAFQEALLARSFNPSPSLDVAAAYLPASDAPMGGDWYDVFPVGDATCMVVGDVAGHGIDAAAAMAELKHAVRAYASEDPTPSGVVARSNRFVHQLHPGLTATLTVATWQPETRTLWRSNAGHPPILRCRPGRYDFISLLGGPNLLLGADPGYEYRQEAIQLRPDTTLVLYSDGLVEQPPESIGETMERLLDFCRRRSSLAPQRLVNDLLLWRLRQGPASDDICVMAVRLP